MTAVAPPVKIRAGRVAALVGGGDLRPQDLEAALARADFAAAADSGADHFTPGVAPRLDAVIGDMDSIAHLAGWRDEPTCQVVEIAEQDSTDLEKCLSTLQAEMLLCVGFLGARLDHTLGVMHALVRHAERRVILLGPDDVAFLAPLRWRAMLEPGARVSFFPLAPCGGVGSEGLRWPIDGLAFEIGRQNGTSNEAVCAEVSAEFDRPGALVLLERRFLDAAMRSLR